FDRIFCRSRQRRSPATSTLGRKKHLRGPRYRRTRAAQMRLGWRTSAARKLTPVRGWRRRAIASRDVGDVTAERELGRTLAIERDLGRHVALGLDAAAGDRERLQRVAHGVADRRRLVAAVHHAVGALLIVA